MNKKIGFLAFAVVFVFLFLSAIHMHPFGEPDETGMDDYMIRGYYNETQDKWVGGAQNETGANNVVTSVVFDYRGFDTLGEATVLFTAVAGVGLALRRRKK